MKQINQSFEGKFHSKQALQAILFSCLGMFGLIFNVFVFLKLLLNMFQRRKNSNPQVLITREQQSKKTLLYLLINLTICDILNCFVLTLNYVHQSTSVASSQDNIHFSDVAGDIVCRIQVFGISLAITASAITLAVISLQRFQEVIHLFHDSFTRKQAIIMPMIIWLIPIIVSSLLAFIYGVADRYPHNCIIKSGNNFFIIIISIGLLCFSIVIPFTIITISYTGNYIVSYTMTKSMIINQANGKRSKLTWKGNDTAFALIIVTAITIASFTPLVIAFMLSSLRKILHSDAYNHSNSDLWQFFKISRIITVIPSIINPFVYRIIVKTLH